MQLKNKSILITGGNRGIGFALARQAAHCHMQIHIVSRHPTEESFENLKDLGASSIKNWSLDLSKKEQIDSFTKDFIAQGFQCDVLVNNAGQLTGGLLEKQNVDAIYQMFQVNLVGLIHLTKNFLPHMLQLKEAKIVNNSSISGMMFLPCASTYAASKAAVLAFTESMRNELKNTSVSTLSMVTPGVKTRMFDEIPVLYGSHLDVRQLHSVSPDEWAKKVFQSIKNDETICWPSGRAYLGVKLAQHCPSLLGRLSQKIFNREA